MFDVKHMQKGNVPRICSFWSPCSLSFWSFLLAIVHLTGLFCAKVQWFDQWRPDWGTETSTSKQSYQMDPKGGGVACWSRIPLFSTGETSGFGFPQVLSTQHVNGALTWPSGRSLASASPAGQRIAGGNGAWSGQRHWLYWCIATWANARSFQPENIGIWWKKAIGIYFGSSKLLQLYYVRGIKQDSIRSFSQRIAWSFGACLDVNRRNLTWLRMFMPHYAGKNAWG